MTENPGILGTILDARAETEYSKKDERNPDKINHIPTARNVPLNSLIDPETGLMKNPEEIRESKVFASNGSKLFLTCTILCIRNQLLLNFKCLPKLG